MTYIPEGYIRGSLPVPPGWSYDGWMAFEPVPQSGGTPSEPTEYGPFQVSDITFWVRGTIDDIEIGLNIDSDSEEDIWVDIDDLAELEDENLEKIRIKAEDVL